MAGVQPTGFLAKIQVGDHVIPGNNNPRHISNESSLKGTKEREIQLERASGSSQGRIISSKVP